LIPESQKLIGWINGDLYLPAGEKIGILPVPDSIRATADIESYHEEDHKFRYPYLAQEQGTKYAVISIHTTAEKVLFKKLMQENPFFNERNANPDWKKCAKVWNRAANGQDIFYKVNRFLKWISMILINYYSWQNIFKLITTSGSAMSMKKTLLPRLLQKSRLFKTSVGTLRDQQLRQQFCNIKFPSTSMSFWVKWLSPI
jgi:hypothetical protein